MKLDLPCSIHNDTFCELINELVFILLLSSSFPPFLLPPIYFSYLLTFLPSFLPSCFSPSFPSSMFFSFIFAFFFFFSTVVWGMSSPCLELVNIPVMQTIKIKVKGIIIEVFSVWMLVESKVLTGQTWTSIGGLQRLYKFYVKLH